MRATTRAGPAQDSPTDEPPDAGRQAVMSTAGTVILLVLLVPILGILGWMVVAASVIKVPAGALGLVLKNGKATDHALAPGRHWVPLLRKTMVVEYPSVELAYRAGRGRLVGGVGARPHRSQPQLRPR